MSAPSHRLRLSGIRKRFGATQALDEVSLDISPGEIHALVGENGAGKSTLMKILSGIHRPDTGSLWLEGAPYEPASPHDARQAGVVMVNQELAIAPHLSVAANIVLGAEPHRAGWLDQGATERTARRALTELGRGDLPIDQPAGRLSVADQQLVEIARALAVGCRVLVLDEPTSSLTQADAQNLFRLLRRLRDQGCAIIYISHFLEEVLELSDRYTVLRDGRSVATGATRSVTTHELARLMVGRQVDELYHRSRRTPGEALLELDGVAGRRKPTRATLRLHRGEILGLAGLVGAGRSELLRGVFGLDPIVRGTVRVATYSGAASPRERWRQGVGLVSEDRKLEGLALSQSIEANLSLPRLSALLSPGRLANEAEGWIRRLGVRCAGPGQPVGALSGGNQQKVAIARLLRNEADLLLIDEPTRGIDIGAKQALYQLLDELALGGKAVLVVSSYLPELMGICDRIAVMCRGELGAARPVHEWTEHAIMLAATGTTPTTLP